MWSAVTHSAIGTLQQRRGLPCQDYGAYRLLDRGQIVMGAIADGAGSARYAHLGARGAVRLALHYLALRHPNRGNQRQSLDLNQPTPPSQADTQVFFTELVQSVQQRFHTYAHWKQYELRDLACTLLVFVATPHWGMGMQIGDGFIVIRQPENSWKLLIQPDKGEYLNETTFLTSPHALDALQVSPIPAPLGFICVGTDGLERVALRLKDWTPFPPFFVPLEELMQDGTTPAERKNYLKTFLNSDRLNAQTSDDKSLLLCRYQES